MAAPRHSENGTCPHCGKATDIDFRPFCSRRCANLDLAKWLGEEYRVPSVEPPDDIEQMFEEGDL